MSIPKFPDFKPLELEDQEEICQTLAAFSPEASDQSFVNLFIWRNYDRPKVAKINGALCFLLHPLDGSPYFLFPNQSEKIDETLKVCFDYVKNRPQLRMVLERQVKKYFERKLDYSFELDHANSDYVYRVTDLINLRGRKYDGKRNWIKKFLSNNRPEYRELTDDQVPSCQELLGRWGKTRSGAIIKYEIQAIKEALNNIKYLNLIARIILVNKQVEAFMLGGELNPETGIVFVQVANREKPGIPQYFHQQFTAHEFSKYKYVNWEQDLGVPGLRKAKLSYHPCKIVYKYDVAKLKTS